MYVCRSDLIMTCHIAASDTLYAGLSSAECLPSEWTVCVFIKVEDHCEHMSCALTATSTQRSILRETVGFDAE